MRNLLLSTVTLLVVPAVAIAAPNFSSHTHTTPIELKPISSSSGLKLAGVCFLGAGDCGDGGFGSIGGDGGYDVDSETQCINEGYTKQNCNSVQEIDGVCPYNPAYGRGCKCVSNLISCPAGQVGEGDGCEGKYASCKCDPKLISCPSNKTGSGVSCGGKYETCVCKAEYQYTSSNCISPRSLSGSSCDGKYTECSCPKGVDEGEFGCKEYYASPCSSVCKVAYPDNCHNRTDNNSQTYGCMKYYDDCPTKCETPYKDNCRNRTEVTAIYGCQKYYADCSSKCEIASTEPACGIGSIYYSDGTCLSADKHDVSKKALGVVVYISDDGQHGQIMAPKLLDNFYCWGDEFNGGWGKDIDNLSNFSTVSSAITDFNSCSNTDKIIAAGDKNVYPAAWAARNYAPTPETKGKWCLPAAGIFKKIYENKVNIEAAIVKIDGVSYFDCWKWDTSHYECPIWSSTEENAYSAWIYEPYWLRFLNAAKYGTTRYYVLPVMEF